MSGPKAGSSRAWSPLAAAAAAAVVFGPTVRYSFLNWDDQPFILRNEAFRGLDPAHLKWMFTTPMAPYMPLSWVSYAVDWRVWGMDPFGFHLTNVVLHAAGAALFCLAARRLLGLALSRPTDDPGVEAGALFAAAAFALHPLRVESVAWVTERRDVLCGVFYLATILFYLDARTAADPAAARRARAAAWVSYGASLLAKGIGVSLPVTLLALDLFPLRRRLDRGVLTEKLPYAGLAAAAAAASLWAQSRSGAVLPIDADPVLRAAHAAYALAFYPWKTVLPWGLSPFYELPPGRAAGHWTFLLSAAAVLAATAAAWRLRARRPAAWSSWLHYLAAAGPVAGLLRVGPQIAADRYSYLACLPLPLLAGGWLASRWGRADAAARRGLGAGALLVALALAAATVRQSSHWRDSVALWTRAASVEPGLTLAHNNLGEALQAAGRDDEALAEFRRAVELDPGYADARNNLGVALDKRGERDAALREFWTALFFKNDDREAYLNLGISYLERGDRERAAFLLDKAVALAPADARARRLLAAATGRPAAP